MLTSTRTDRVRAVAFRFRGGVWAVAFLFAWLVARPTLALLAVVTAFVAAGQMLRFWAAGYIRTYRGETHAAASLATGGPYAFVRNPLYLGNGLIGLGLSLSSAPAVVALFSLLFAVLYVVLIVPQEERFLSAAFGESYERYRQRTPRWIPAAWPAPHRGAGRFDWQAAWSGEVHSARLHALCLVLLAARPFFPRPAW
jgi:protein-S-isoprenylcysteine O-methyltransferase Ste14